MKKGKYLINTGILNTGSNDKIYKYYSYYVGFEVYQDLSYNFKYNGVYNRSDILTYSENYSRELRGNNNIENFYRGEIEIEVLGNFGYANISVYHADTDHVNYNSEYNIEQLLIYEHDINILEEFSILENKINSTLLSSGSVLDTDNNTRIVAERFDEINTPLDNNQLDFYTNGIRRLQIDECGNILYGNLYKNPITENDYNIKIDFSNGTIISKSDISCNNIIANKFISHLDISSTNILSNEISCNNINIYNDISINNNLFINGNIYGPSNMIIDPSLHNDNSGTLIIKGNLIVEGNETVINILEEFSILENKINNNMIASGSVLDTDYNTKIVAERFDEINTPLDNNQLDFHTNGIRRLQIDECGNILYGNLYKNPITENDYNIKIDFSNGTIISKSDISCNNIIANKFISHLDISSTNILSNEISCNNINIYNDISINNNLFINGNIYGPSNMIIDPSLHNDNSGTLIIKGNLIVEGNETVINSNIIDISDYRILLSTSYPNKNGAGIEVSNNKLFVYDSTFNSWSSNINLSCANDTYLNNIFINNKLIISSQNSQIIDFTNILNGIKYGFFFDGDISVNNNNILSSKNSNLENINNDIITVSNAIKFKELHVFSNEDSNSNSQQIFIPTIERDDTNLNIMNFNKLEIKNSHNVNNDGLSVKTNLTMNYFDIKNISTLSCNQINSGNISCMAINTNNFLINSGPITCTTLNTNNNQITSGAISCTTINTNDFSITSGPISSGIINTNNNTITCGAINTNNNTITSGTISSGEINTNDNTITCGAINTNNNTITCGTISSGEINTNNNTIACGTISSNAINTNNNTITCGTISSNAINTNNNTITCGTISSGAIDTNNNTITCGSINTNNNTFTCGAINTNNNTITCGAINTNNNNINCGNITCNTINTNNNDMNTGDGKIVAANLNLTNLTINSTISNNTLTMEFNKMYAVKDINYDGIISTFHINNANLINGSQIIIKIKPSDGSTITIYGYENPLLVTKINNVENENILINFAEDLELVGDGYSSIIITATNISNVFCISASIFKKKSD